MALKFITVLGAAAVALGQTVTIANGAVQGGKCPQADINFFLSIPYAESPVGDLRFAAPKAYNRSFNGTYKATDAAPVCPQFGTFFVETGPWSEDCLFIDVYAPATAEKGSNLPVKVWIYGGADQAGGISSPNYDGCLSANDSILVSINYRLGPLGFLTLEPAGLTGNYAIQDQLLGLQWVQDNIAAFGGDKDHVLLFGQSAGAFNAFAISTLPQAKSLMKAAVLESGAGTDFLTIAETTKFHELYAANLNCSVSDVGCLRSKTVAELNNTFLALPSNGAPILASLLVNSGNGLPWGPVVDGTIIRAQPSSAGIKVPSIIGTTASEGTVFVLLDYLANIVSLNQTEYDTVLTDYFGPFAADVNTTYPYSDFSTTSLPGFEAIANIITDYGFRCLAYRALLGGIANGVPVYTYNFNHTPSCPWITGLKPSLLPIVGASHTSDLPFVFGLVDSTLNNCTFMAAEKQLGEFMRAAWTSMAATGTPGSGWPTFAANSSQGIIFEDSALVGKVDYSICTFWDQIDARVSQLDANMTATSNLSTTGTSTGASGTATKKNAGARMASTGMIGLSAVVLVGSVLALC